MPDENHMTVAEILVEYALEDKLEHRAVMAKLPADKLAAVIGRKAKLVVDGKEGGKFIIMLTPDGILRDNSDREIRNEIWMTDTTFMDIVIGELDPKTAAARGQVVFTGDRSLYDSHEIMDILQMWLLTKLKPVAQRMMKSLARGK